jgi:hypothetical protein
MREGRRGKWWFHLQAVPTKQTPHFGPTLRESEWRAHCHVADSLIGISQQRSRRLALHPAIRFRTPGFSVNRP